MSGFGGGFGGGGGGGFGGGGGGGGDGGFMSPGGSDSQGSERKKNRSQTLLPITGAMFHKAQYNGAEDVFTFDDTEIHQVNICYQFLWSTGDPLFA